MNYKLIWEPRGVLIQFSGEISINDIYKASIAYQGDFRYDDLSYVIADYSQITRCTARPEDIDNIWAIDTGAKLSNPSIKKAIVTTSDDVIQLASRYKNNQSSAFVVKVFPTQDEARAWINA